MKNLKLILIILFVFINSLYSQKMYLLNGPTSIGGLKMMKEYNKITINTVNAPNNMLSLIVKGEADIAAIPANMAAIIFNRQLDYKVIAVISETKLFIVSANNKIQTINDIKNSTVYCGTKLAAPDLMLQYLISKEKIPNVNINYSLSNPDLSKAVASKNVDIAILPEPFLSSAMLENKDVHIVVEMSKYIDNYPVAVLIAKNYFINHNKMLVKEILDEYKKSTDYIINSKEEIKNLLKERNMIINAEAAYYGLNRMGLVFYDGEKMKFALNSYYNFLFNFDKKSIGGKIPNDNFYYIEK
ncbi:ABC transporter substrate-binding protein [Brachyspira murdochii]|uniref:ABC-type nitrate/sulfonate/bicarbonate transport system, periplasmic component n=1 Tax=Brachyspira murdochii (strain ATCC 51284 / DSM 12563 / 56-150) TaxID=526224 RepID=D5U6M7_BRAM5|nr:ABC transporter substrate-binding protein [Brachyspira murdochii]ADG70593.1 ABC-type nitrate/sulfonate/bicarbonate transport system, periplasmic component [Brachyspira murdochii DSM 12563]